MPCVLWGSNEFCCGLDAAGIQRMTQQFMIEKGTGLAQGRRDLRRAEAGGGGIDGRRLFHKTQGIAVHFGAGRRTVGRCEQKRSVGLLARAEITVERMVQQTPAVMNEIASGSQNLNRRRVSKEAGEIGGRKGRPHAVRTKL